MRNPKWADYFARTVSSIAAAFNREFPKNVDREALEAIEDRINQVWLDPDGTWEDFRSAVGEYKIFFWNLRR
jgi:hypothetical protein